MRTMRAMSRSKARSTSTITIPRRTLKLRRSVLVLSTKSLLTKIFDMLSAGARRTLLLILTLQSRWVECSKLWFQQLILRQVEAKGLKPWTTYYYQFNVCSSSKKSPLGRTKTIPSPNQHVSEASIAVFSCSNYRKLCFVRLRQDHPIADCGQRTATSMRTETRHGKTTLTTLCISATISTRAESVSWARIPEQLTHRMFCSHSTIIEPALQSTELTWTCYWRTKTILGSLFGTIMVRNVVDCIKTRYGCQLILV